MTYHFASRGCFGCATALWVVVLTNSGSRSSNIKKKIERLIKPIHCYKPWEG